MFQGVCTAKNRDVLMFAYACVHFKIREEYCNMVLVEHVYSQVSYTQSPGKDI